MSERCSVLQNSSISPISFGTNIRIVNRDEFKLQTGFWKNLVDWPWTARQIIRAPQVYTQGVSSCTAGGIITKSRKGDSFDMVMFHINPGEKANKNIKKIERTIKRRLGRSKPIQAFIFGCKSGLDSSSKMFDNLEEIIKHFNVPYTRLKGSAFGKGPVNSAYDGYTDELIISSRILDKTSENNGIAKNKISDFFDETMIAPQNSVSIG